MPREQFQVFQSRPMAAMAATRSSGIFLNQQKRKAQVAVAVADTLALPTELQLERQMEVQTEPPIQADSSSSLRTVQQKVLRDYPINHLAAITSRLLAIQFVRT